MLMKIAVLIFVLAGIYFFFKIRDKKEKEQDYREKDDNLKAVDMKYDAICGSYVEETTKYKVKLHNKIYYFCSQDCKDKFIKKHTISD